MGGAGPPVRDRMGSIGKGPLIAHYVTYKLLVCDKGGSKGGLPRWCGGGIAAGTLVAWKAAAGFAGALVGVRKAWHRRCYVLQYDCERAVGWCWCVGGRGLGVVLGPRACRQPARSEVRSQPCLPWRLDAGNRIERGEFCVAHWTSGVFGSPLRLFGLRIQRG